MKKIALFLTAVLLLCFFASCDKPEPVLPADEEESMKDVRYLGWNMAATDGTYIFADVGTLRKDSMTREIGKLNVRTGITSSVCRDETCNHEEENGCKTYASAYILFTWNHKVFFPVSVPDTSADGTETIGNWCAEASYDAETGEYRTYDRYLSASTTSSYSPILDGDTMYVKCQLPIRPDAETKDDYRLCFCATDLVSGTRTVLFTEDDCPTLAKVNIPLFVADGYAYFYWGEAGIFVKVSLDGKETVVLREQGTLQPIPDSFGVYYSGGWIYCLSNDGADPVPTRISAADGTTEYLGTEATWWLIVTNRHIYYQPKELTADGKMRICQMDLDGSNKHCLTEMESLVVTDAIFAQGGLYLWQLSQFYRVDVGTGDVIRVTGDGWAETAPAS